MAFVMSFGVKVLSPIYLLRAVLSFYCGCVVNMYLIHSFTVEKFDVDVGEQYFKVTLASVAGDSCRS